MRRPVANRLIARTLLGHNEARWNALKRRWSHDIRVGFVRITSGMLHPLRWLAARPGFARRHEVARWAPSDISVPGRITPFHVASPRMGMPDGQAYQSD